MLSHSLVVEINWDSEGGKKVGLKGEQHWGGGGVQQRLADVKLKDQKEAAGRGNISNRKRKHKKRRRKIEFSRSHDTSWATDTET